MSSPSSTSAFSSACSLACSPACSPSCFPACSPACSSACTRGFYAHLDALIDRFIERARARFVTRQKIIKSGGLRAVSVAYGPKGAFKVTQVPETCIRPIRPALGGSDGRTSGSRGSKRGVEEKPGEKETERKKAKYLVDKKIGMVQYRTPSAKMSLYYGSRTVDPRILMEDLRVTAYRLNEIRNFFAKDRQGLCSTAVAEELSGQKPHYPLDTALTKLGGYSHLSFDLRPASKPRATHADYIFFISLYNQKIAMSKHLTEGKRPQGEIQTLANALDVLASLDTRLRGEAKILKLFVELNDQGCLIREDKDLQVILDHLAVLVDYYSKIHGAVKDP